MDKLQLTKLKKIANNIEPIIEFLLFPYIKVAGKNKWFEKAMLRPLMKGLSKSSGVSYLSYYSVPKQIDEIKPYENKEDFSDYCIILQGPILYDDSFTLNTIKLYLRLFYNVKIVISTWKGIQEDFKVACESLGVILVENEEPQNGGPLNINFQLISSKNGALKAKEIGCTYTAKTRTNQRFYARDWLSYISNQLEIFLRLDPDHSRLLFTSYGMSYLKRPFCLCDNFSAGYTENIVNLYSTMLDEREKNYFKKCGEDTDAYALKIRYDLEPYKHCNHDVVITREKFFNYMCPEEYIVYNYCNSYCFDIEKQKDIMTAYYRFLKNYVVIIDEAQLQILWPKYSEYSSQKLNEHDYFGKLDYKKWLDIFLNWEE